MFDRDKMDHPELSPVGKKQKEVAGTAWWELGDCDILLYPNVIPMDWATLQAGGLKMMEYQSMQVGQICVLFPEPVEGFHANL